MHIASHIRFPSLDHRLPDDARDRPILFFDSGLGGLTVASACRRLMPDEKIIYVGDTARVPYGSKSDNAIRAASTQLLRATFERLATTNELPKHVVIACNSASAVAKQALRDIATPLGIGVTGMIQPGVRAACVAGGTRPRPAIGVIATDATIRSRAYDTAIIHRRPRSHVLLRATPLLVPMVEEGRKEDDPLVRLSLRQYLLPMIQRAEKLADRLDALVLACTHYPLLANAIRDVVGPRDDGRRLGRVVCTRPPPAAQEARSSPSPRAADVDASTARDRRPGTVRQARDPLPRRGRCGA